MEVGEILALLRREKGLGQKELATYLSLSTGTISNYENGVHFPDLNTLSRLADFFDVTTDYLLNRTQFRYDYSKLSQQVSEEYSLSDVVDTVLACNPNSVSHLMEYALFLKAKQESSSSERR